MNRVVISLILASFAFISTANATLPENYTELTAAQKQELVWQRISEKPYEKLPEMNFIPTGEGKMSHIGRTAHAAANLGQAFDHVGDEMPAGRVKIIHAYGSAAKVEFIPSPNHSFTGLFQTGAVGMVRLSLGLPYHSTKSFVPGMAIKFFVDGQDSKNMHVMQRLEGQGQDTNFFKYTFTNKLPKPTERNTKIGKKYFGRFVENPTFLMVSHVASIRANGLHEGIIKYPFQIFFKPAEGLSLSSQSQDFRVELAQLNEGVKLYDVYGTPSEHVTTPIYIGSLVLRSRFVASEYSDKVLYFQHEGSLRRTFWTGRRIEKPTPPEPPCEGQGCIKELDFPWWHPVWH